MYVYIKISHLHRQSDAFELDLDPHYDPPKRYHQSLLNPVK